MLEYAIYSVISPEGCASILYKSAEKAADAAESMGVTSERLLKLGLVDRVVQEPLGGAHRNPDDMADSLGESLAEELASLSGLSGAELVEQRRAKWRDYGEFQDLAATAN